MTDVGDYVHTPLRSPLATMTILSSQSDDIGFSTKMRTPMRLRFD